MKSVWRSWLWNLVLFLCMAIMASIYTGIAAGRLRPGADGAAVAWGVVFVLAAALFWTGAIRGLFLGVYILADRIVIRRFGRTTAISWKEIESIENGTLTSGASSVASATAPVVRWRRSGDASSRELELNVLGGYRSGPATLAERATRELNTRLAEYRAKNSL